MQASQALQRGFYGGFHIFRKALLMSWLIISRLSCGNSITSSRSWIQLLFITSLKSIFYLFCCLWSNGDFKGGRPSKGGKKTLASRFQCCKEYSQFAPYLAFSILAFFKGIRISIPQLWIAKISRRPKCAFLIWWWGLFWNLVVDFQQSKQKVKTSFLAL